MTTNHTNSREAIAATDERPLDDRLREFEYSLMKQGIQSSLFREIRAALAQTTSHADSQSELLELLESAQNGLKWYQAEHPEDASPADDELHERIDAALAHISSRTPDMEKQSAKAEPVADAIQDNELPGMWERADFEGGREEVRGPNWKSPQPQACNVPDWLPTELHPDTKNLVLGFAQAMAEKLLKAEQDYEYGNGWTQPDWMDDCRADLIHHLAKGDPRDVANYCAFLWFHGEKTMAPIDSEKALEALRDAANLLAQSAAPYDEACSIIRALITPAPSDSGEVK